MFYKNMQPTFKQKAAKIATKNFIQAQMNIQGNLENLAEKAHIHSLMAHELRQHKRLDVYIPT